MFLGESNHSLDSKHRVFVPKRFQEVLNRNSEGHFKVILTRGFDGCLFLFSEEGFADALARLRTQAFGGQELRNTQRMFFSNTHKLQLDASGRVVVPEKLRKQAGIEKDVVMVGVAERAEIWDRTRWEKLEEANADKFDELDVVLVGNGGPPPATA